LTGPGTTEMLLASDLLPGEGRAEIYSGAAGL
jgi:hypothetical protein